MRNKKSEPEQGSAPVGIASPYRIFTRDQWATLRADAPMTLSAEEIKPFASVSDRISQSEVETIYLPLSRLLSLYVEAAQELFRATGQFLMTNGDSKVPFIIGIAGSVAVGKSTTARVLKALLARWPSTPKVDLITTDGFLYPNAVLQQQGLMERKGFPESYDTNALLRFLHEIKSGKNHVKAPLYSHLVYDVVPGEMTLVEQPDILIVEGLNVLQPARLPRDGSIIPFVSDYFDFSIYLDADEDDLHTWYIDRFMTLRTTAFRDPKSYFRRYAELSDIEAYEIADDLWKSINLVNLRENVLPTRQRANLILRKGSHHRIEQVSLRRL